MDTPELDNLLNKKLADLRDFRQNQEPLWQVVRGGAYTRTTATSFVAKQHNVFPQTVLDKYCRQLGLTAEQFDRLLQQPGAVDLRKLLKSKSPGYDDVIDSVLG
jgi:hypothetical protein